MPGRRFVHGSRPPDALGRPPRSDGGNLGAIIEKTSAILKSLADSENERLSLHDVIKAAGARAHGFGLLLFALPETIPVPLPGVSAIVAIPLILIAAHLIAFGEGSGLPQRALTQTIPTSVIQKVAKLTAPVLQWTESWSHPRLKTVARRHRLIGVVCLLLGLVLLAPIPFGNFVPALGIVVIAFGMLQRDGVVILIGLCFALALGIGLYFAAESLAAMIGG